MTESSPAIAAKSAHWAPICHGIWWASPPPRRREETGDSEFRGLTASYKAADVYTQPGTPLAQGSAHSHRLDQQVYSGFSVLKNYFLSSRDHSKLPAFLPKCMNRVHFTFVAKEPESLWTPCTQIHSSSPTLTSTPPPHHTTTKPQPACSSNPSHSPPISETPGTATNPVSPAPQHPAPLGMLTCCASLLAEQSP